jgi:hypothetical protein
MPRPVQSLPEDRRPFRQAQRVVRIVFQGHDRPAAVRVPHPAFERDERPRVTGAKGFREPRGVQGAGTEGELLAGHDGAVYVAG